MSVRILVVILALFVLAQWLRLWRLRILRQESPRRRAELAGSRKAAGWRWAGLALGLFAAIQMASLGPLGLGLMFAPVVFGLCVIGGVAVGELATIPSRDDLRTAPVEARTFSDYLPRRLGGLVAASTLLLGALLVTTTLMGSADDGGRAGRSLFRQCSAQLSESAGPWPGLFYSVPLAVAVVVGLLCAGVALRRVVQRPRRGSAAELVAADDMLRRRSAEDVVAATGVMVATSLTGVSLTAAGKLLGFSCPPLWWTVLGFSLLAIAALMSLLLIWCLALLLAGPRIRPGSWQDTARPRDGARP